MEIHNGEEVSSARLITHDNEWQEDTVQIISEESQKGSGMLQLIGKDVLANGISSSQETKFRYYSGSHPHDPFTTICMFESLADASKGQMICIDKMGKLSCREGKVYSRIDLNETDIVFIQRRISEGSSLIFLELAASHIPEYIGFDRSGKPLFPAKVNPTKEEAHFMLSPCKL